MAAEVEERGPIPNLALNAILIPVFEETALVNILFNKFHIYLTLLANDTECAVSHWSINTISVCSEFTVFIQHFRIYIVSKRP